MSRMTMLWSIAKLGEELPLLAFLANRHRGCERKGRKSIAIEPASLATYDAIVIATDHDAVDWGAIAAHGRNGLLGPNVMRA
jgi:hypothetical protein